MAIVALHGHAALQQRLLDISYRGKLPASLLLHGTRGIGKQRVALWLAQRLLCEADADQPCGQCRACRRVVELQHPDLYWVYPKARLKDPNPRPEDVLQDYAESTAERVARHGLYPPSSGSDGLYVSTIRTIVYKAGLAPALGHRKVFIIGDAERMVSQEGADQAANAFLKLLEEPHANTTLILTSSEPGALLPTIRSRVVAFRCAPLTDAEVRGFVSDPMVRPVLDELHAPARVEDCVALAAGAPGMLLASDSTSTALTSARAMLARPGGTMRRGARNAMRSRWHKARPTREGHSRIRLKHCMS